MKYEDIVGDAGTMSVDLKEAAQARCEILRLTREWREKLGTKCGLLDQYLAGILNALADTGNARDNAEAGFDNALSDLHHILRQIKEGNEDEARRHPFFPNVKRYMAAHPFLQDDLYYETYCVGLFEEYIPYAVMLYMEEFNGKFEAALDEYDVPRLREALLSSGAGITAERLDYLNVMIGRRRWY